MKDDTTTFHYFGSTAFGWRVGQSRAEVIEALARDAGADIIRRNMKPNGGLYVWTCFVPLPQSAPYEIEQFAPTVPYQYGQAFNIVNIKGHVTPIDPKRA